MKLPATRLLSRSVLARSLTVAAAVLLIAALAAGTLAPQGMTLRDGLEALDGSALARLRQLLSGRIGQGVWAAFAQPVLVRPLWLLPVSLGLICAGGAISTSLPPRASRRRRS